MSNPRRRHRRNFNEPGYAHELTFSCYHRFAFLKAERACEWLKESIEASRVEFDYDLWAYVFMPEHVHLLVRPRRVVYDIADIRQAIKEPVGRQAIKYLSEHAPEWLPRITRKRGQKTERLFWQSGGGFDRNVVQGTTLLSMIEYIPPEPRAAWIGLAGDRLEVVQRGVVPVRTTHTDRDRSHSTRMAKLECT